MNKLDLVAITVLFIVAFSVWTLPLQNDSRPFGEGDAAWHFSIGDYIASSDNPIYRIPFYIGQWYYGYNEVLGPNAPEYPPPNHYNYALMQVSGGERFVPIIMYRAIASFLGIFAVYFLISKLYGSAAAIIASSGLIFSLREQLLYLWGQQPTLISVVIAPVTFYAFYRYLVSYYNQNSKREYLYMTVFLLGSQYLLHIQGFALSVLVLAAFTVLMFLKYRKLPFINERKKHLVYASLIFMIITLPFIAIYLGTPQIGSEQPDFSRVFSWGVDPNLVAGSYPPAYTSFSGQYSLFLVPLLILGIGLSLLRRKSKDLLMLGWLVGVYLVLHTDLYLGVSVERAARMLIAEPALFYSFIGIGAVSWLSFLKLRTRIKSILKIAIVIVVIFLIYQNSYETSSNTLSGAYPDNSILRITPPQAELADWLRANTPENAYIYYIPENSDYKLGTWQYQKLRWMLASSQRYVSNYNGFFADNADTSDSQFYFIFDYTDLAGFINSPGHPLQGVAQQSADSLLQFEAANFNSSQPLYNTNNIRVYEVEAEDFK